MYSKILLPVSFDADRDTQAAIAVATGLSASDAEVTFLHVIEEMPSYVASYVDDQVTLAARDHAIEELKKLQARLPGSLYAHEQGHSGRSIIDYAERHEADCIIIASHKPEFADYFLGSTATHVVRHAKCAIHVVR